MRMERWNNCSKVLLLRGASLFHLCSVKVERWNAISGCFYSVLLLTAVAPLQRSHTN